MIFAFSSVLLAYFSLSFLETLVIFIGGIILPWVVGAWFYSRKVSKSDLIYQKEILPSVSFWILIILILAAGLLRCFQLTTLSLWPLTDEALDGYYSMQVADHGHFQWIYGFTNLPPLYIWLQGLVFKIFGISLTSLWSLPAVLSLASVIVFFLAARTYFSKSFSFLSVLLMGFSFWPLYVGRFSFQGGLLLFWETAALLAAGLWWEERETSAGRFGAFLFGLFVGAGFYTFTSWPTAALLFTFGMGWYEWSHPKRRFFYPYLLGLLFAYFPLAAAAIPATDNDYLRYVIPFRWNQPLFPQLAMACQDLWAFFFRTLVPSNLFAYKPFWGGYWNPLLSAAFFIGTFEFFRKRAHPFVLLWVFAFLLFFLPGFLTGGIEMCRVLLILPVLLLGVATGISILLMGLRPIWRPWGLSVFILFSMGLDSYHLFGVYHRIWTQPQGNWFACKSLERLRAYEILKDFQSQAGPGFILSDMVPDIYDQSFSLATHSFNATVNPAIDPSQARWVALLINVNYRTYLIRQFPEGKWFDLAPDVERPDGGLMLGIIPLTSSHFKILKQYFLADRACFSLVPQVFDCRDYKSRTPVIQSLESLYPLFSADPFLRSCFYEKIAENEYADRNYDAQVKALKQAIQLGIPTPHLYNNLGALYFRRSRFTEARQAFQKALQFPFNATSASAGLQAILTVEKTGKWSESQ